MLLLTDIHFESVNLVSMVSRMKFITLTFKLLERYGNRDRASLTFSDPKNHSYYSYKHSNTLKHTKQSLIHELRDFVCVRRDERRTSSATLAVSLRFLFDGQFDVLNVPFSPSFLIPPRIIF